MMRPNLFMEIDRVVSQCVGIDVFVAASILVIAIGVKYGAEDNVSIGPVHFSGLALSALVGVTLNAILPGKLVMKVKSIHGKEKH